MGKSWQEKKGQKGTKKDANKKSDTKVFVKKYKYFAKGTLSPYPNEEDGCPFYMNKKCQDEKELFSSGTITATRTPDNCEMFHRQGMAVCLMASAADHGAKLLFKRLPPNRPNAGEAFDKTGLPGLMDLLGTERGNDFVKAMEVLNVGRVKKPEENEVEPAVTDMFRFFKRDGKELRKQLSRTASFCASMYLFTMNVSEHLDLYENRKKWAKFLEDAKKQSKEMRAWLKDPENSDKYLAAIVAAFMEKVKTNKVAKDKKKKAADSSSEGDKKGTKKNKSGSSASSAAKSSSSSSADSDADSSSSGSRKNKKKKSRKDDKKDKKKERKRRLSSSASEKAKPKRERKAAEDKKNKDTDRAKDSKAPEKKSKADKPPVPKMTFSDEESDGPAAETFKSWPPSAVDAMVAAIQTVEKKNEATLQEMRAIVADVPEAALAAAGLDDVRFYLKSLSRAPKAAKRKAICERLMTLAAQYNSFRDVAGTTDAGAPTDAVLPKVQVNVDPAQLQKALTEWRVSDQQELKDKAFCLSQDIPYMNNVQELLASIPTAVVSACGVAEWASTLSSWTGKEPSKEDSLGAVATISAIEAAADACRKKQGKLAGDRAAVTSGGGGSAGSAGAGTAAPKAHPAPTKT